MIPALVLAGALFSVPVFAVAQKDSGRAAMIGPGPHYLVDAMADSELRKRLLACAANRKVYKPSAFSIGHRGAPLQFPEHTKESYLAAIRMGAGFVECDVTYTADHQLVCRHDQCDLHRTTNILDTPLAKKCSGPFQPAADGRKAGARCCTSDITLKEYKTLCGRMDSFDTGARSVQDSMGGNPAWRTQKYAGCGTLMSHGESIALLDEADVGFVPELKVARVKEPLVGGYSREDFIRQVISEYKKAGIKPARVRVQSFFTEDLQFLNKAEPAFGAGAIYLDDRVYRDKSFRATRENMKELAQQGIRAVAPPLFALVQPDGKGGLAPSPYAVHAKSAGLELLTWTIERSGPLSSGGGWYYHTVKPAIKRDGDVFVMLDTLARKVGVTAVFSDWPATTTFYANCAGL